MAIDERLRQSAYYGNLIEVERCLSSRANINNQSSEGNTALHLASDRGHSKVVLFLLAKGANKDLVNRDGRSPWDLAAQHSHNVVLAFFELCFHLPNPIPSLFAKMQDTDLDMPEGKRHCLDWGLEQEPLALEVILRRLSPDVNGTEPEHNHTPLHRVAGKCKTFLTPRPGDGSRVELLLAVNADVNKEDKYGNTPLHLAAQAGNCAAVAWLLNARAKVNIQNRDHRTPISLAKEKLRQYEAYPNLKIRWDITIKLLEIYQNPLPEGAQVTFDMLRWKELSGVREIKAYGSDLAELLCPFSVQGGMTLPLSCQIEHLANLSSVVFQNCKLRTINGLPDQLQSIAFDECNFVKVDTERTRGGPFLLHHLSKVKKIVFLRCSGDLSIDFSPDTASLVDDLMILDQSSLRDEHVHAFPSSLKFLEIRGGELTVTSYEKLPRSLRHLKLEGCPKITRKFIRRFPRCDVDPVSIGLTRSEQLAKQLQEHVKGQILATQTVCTNLIPLLRNKPSNRPGPQMILFFVGPSGVGKSELAKAIADITQRPLLKFEMETFAPEGSVTRLIGASPSFAGHGQGSPVTKQVSEQPNAVLLLDEIEKAHLSVKQAFLGIFDTGLIQDAAGGSVNFKNTIIVMTSNLCSREIGNLDWSHAQEAYKKAKMISTRGIEDSISPEFTGRINEVVPFSPLTEAVLRESLEQEIKGLVDRFRTNENIVIEIDNSIYTAGHAEVSGTSLGFRTINNFIAKLEKSIDVCCYDEEEAIKGISRRGNIPTIKLESNPFGEVSAILDY